MSRGDHVQEEVLDGVLTVTFDRDAKLNAISPEMTAALWSAVRRLQEDDAVRVLVITGNGRYFSAGIDLNAPQPRTVATSGSHLRRLLREHHLLYDEMEAVEKPVVLAAQGPCLGAGLEMACSCDFRLASDRAHFQLPEIRLGLLPGSGGVSRLTRLVGPHWAKWLAMAGQSVSADQALAMGLVHEVIPLSQFSGRVHEFATSLCDLSSEAVGLAKLAVDMCARADARTGRDIERIANTELCLASVPE